MTARTAEAGGVAAELAARWASEPGWTGIFVTLPGRNGDDPCEGCGGAITWEPARTLTHCRACAADGHPSVTLPPAVYRYHERQARRAEVAVRTGPDESAERAARVQLRAQKDAVQRRVQAWLESIADEHSYDRVQFQRQAFDLAAMLRAYLPEISAAKDEATLVGVFRDINELITGEQGSALRTEYEQAQQRAARAIEAEQRAEYQQELSEQQEREQIAAEREARQLAQQERKAITSGRTTTTTRLAASPYTPAYVMIANWQQKQQKKEQKIASNGKCAFKHWTDVPAERLYGVPLRIYSGQMSGYRVAGTPEYRACAKHRETAEAQLNRDGYTDVAYWEL